MAAANQLVVSVVNYSWKAVTAWTSATSTSAGIKAENKISRNILEIKIAAMAEITKARTSRIKDMLSSKTKFTAKRCWARELPNPISELTDWTLSCKLFNLKPHSHIAS
jgi:hypothetical protein